MHSQERFWLLVLVVACLALLGVFAMNRLLPDRSLQCVQAGGDWHDEGDGHCERTKR